MPRVIVIVVLLASLGANVWLLTRPREQVSVAPRPVVAATPLKPAAPTEVLAPIFTTLPQTPAEYGIWKTRLEQLGLPPYVIRIVLSSLIHQEFERRRREVRGAPGPDEYWRGLWTMAESSEVLAAMRQISLEQRRLTRELGVDGDLEEDSERRMYGKLPPEKVARLKRIFADYADMEEQLYTDVRDRNSPEVKARAALLAKEKRADLERSLTREELLDYDMRNSRAANQLRNRLGGFKTTEAEFVAAFPQIQAIIENNGGSELGGGVEGRRAWERANKEIDAALQQTLGEARYQELTDSNDRSLRLTREFVTETRLPPPAAAELLAVQREFAPKLQAVDRNRDLNDNQRDAQAYALATEARERLLRALGPEQFEVYKRRAGTWLGDSLARKAPTPSPK